MEGKKHKYNKLWKILLAVCLFAYPILSNTTIVQAYSSFQYLGKKCEK